MARHESATTDAVGRPEILTVDEAAAFLRVNRKTLYEAIRRNEVPGVTHVAGCIRIHRDTFLAWVRGAGQVA